MKRLATALTAALLCACSGAQLRPEAGEFVGAWRAAYSDADEGWLELHDDGRFREARYRAGVVLAESSGTWNLLGAGLVLVTQQGPEGVSPQRSEVVARDDGRLVLRGPSGKVAVLARVK